MPETKNIHKDAGWFASYMDAPDGGNDSQGQALVECQILKIKQGEELKEALRKLDIPEVNAVLEKYNKEVSFTKGSFTWIG